MASNYIYRFTGSISADMIPEFEEKIKEFNISYVIHKTTLDDYNDFVIYFTDKKKFLLFFEWWCGESAEDIENVFNEYLINGMIEKIIL